MVFPFQRIIANNRKLILLVIGLTLFFLLISQFYQKLDNQLLRINFKTDVNYAAVIASPDSFRQKFPLTASYCNAPHQIDTNGESLPSNVLSEHGLTLTSVVIAIRHGDRGPLRYLRHLDKVDCTVDNYLPQNSKDAVNAYKVVDEHHYNLLQRYLKAESSRLRKIVQFPGVYRIVPEDGCHPQHLTVIGALQHLILGSKLAEVYKQELNIDAMSTSKLMKVYSTNYPRTFQSAFAFMFGFIDPTSHSEHEHFPTIESTHGHLFCGSQKFCAKCEKLLQISRQFEEMRVKLMSSNQAIIDALFKIRTLIAPSNISATFHSFEAMFDGVMTYLCHDSKIPCDDLTGCATEDDIKHLVQTLGDFYTSVMKTKDYRKMNLIKAFGFYQQLIDHFNTVNKNANQFKILLFSGHDVTLIPISSVLDIYDGVIPPFASRIIFETYRSESGTNYLRVIYNGKDMTKSVEICNSSTHCVQLQDASSKSFTLIRLDAFHHFIQFKLKELTNSDTIENACVATT